MSVKRMSRAVVRNQEEIYEETMRKRGVKYIDQYPTAQMHHPTVDEIANIQTIGHVWKVGDRYSKLAYEHYGDAELWWVIAWYNQLPTESHINLGDTIMIPTPIETVLPLLRLRG